MMVRRMCLVVILSTALVAAGSIAATSVRAADGPVGVFSRVEGNVDVLRTNEPRAVVVRPGDPVSLGDAVRTKRRSKAEIRFKDDTVLQLAPETRIIVDQYTFSGNRRESGFLSLLRGKVRAIVSKIRAAVMPVSATATNFTIKTPTAIAGVKGTDLIVYYNRGITGVMFLDGFGFVFNPQLPGRVVPVHRGQATFVLRGDSAPLSAQNVQQAALKRHLRDTSGNAPEGAGGTPEGPPSGQPPSGPPAGPPIDVVADNLTIDTLTTVNASLGIAPPAAIQSVTTAITQALQPPATEPPPPPPITETDPALLTTPVTVNVAIP